MVPDQMPRALPHRLDIERRHDLPYPAALERRRRAAVQDAVEVDARRGREARVERVRHCFGSQSR